MRRFLIVLGSLLGSLVLGLALLSRDKIKTVDPMLEGEPFLPMPTTPIGDLKSLRLVLRCARCNWKVVLALSDLAKKHGTRLPVWRAIDRLRCHRRKDGALCGSLPRSVVLVECETYGKSTRITRQVVVRGG